MRALLLKSLFHVFAALPLRVAYVLGIGLGGLFLLLSRKRQRTARINLELCFPEMAAAARHRLLRHNFIEIGKSFAEIGALWTRDRETINRLVRQTSGEQDLQRLIARGKGVILASPHLGAWEIVNLYCSMRYPFTALYRAPPMAQMGQLMRRARERFGARLLPADNSGIRGLYKALERGEIVGMLPDQVPSRNSGSVFAPFFGIPANTMVLLSRLAIKTGAPVVFAYAERLPQGLHYHIHFVPAPAAIGHGSVESSAVVVNQMVEQCVRALPQQYQWIYKRFRGRPLGEKGFY